MTETTNQLPRSAHISNSLYVAQNAIQQASEALGRALRTLQPAANADSTLSSLLESLESLNSAAQEFNMRITQEAQAEKALIDQHMTEVKNLRDKATKRMFYLCREIDRAKAIFAAKLRHDENRKKELEKAGLSAKEIARIHKPLSSGEVELHHAQIKVMEAERNACGCFVHDGPRFDPSLLAGTSLYPAAPAEAA